MAVVAVDPDPDPDPDPEPEPAVVVGELVACVVDPHPATTNAPTVSAAIRRPHIAIPRPPSVPCPHGYGPDAINTNPPSTRCQRSQSPVNALSA